MVSKTFYRFIKILFDGKYNKFVLGGNNQLKTMRKREEEMS